MTLSKDELKKFRKELREAFHEDELRRLLADLDIRYDNVTTAGKPHVERIFELTHWAERHNPLADIAREVAKERPRNAELQRIASPNPRARSGRSPRSARRRTWSRPPR
jgi:hypothetical protein